MSADNSGIFSASNECVSEGTWSQNSNTNIYEFQGNEAPNMYTNFSSQKMNSNQQYDPTSSQQSDQNVNVNQQHDNQQQSYQYNAQQNSFPNQQYNQWAQQFNQPYNSQQQSSFQQTQQFPGPNMPQQQQRPYRGWGSNWRKKRPPHPQGIPPNQSQPHSTHKQSQFRKQKRLPHHSQDEQGQNFQQEETEQEDGKPLKVWKSFYGQSSCQPWFNEEIALALIEKKDCYKKWKALQTDESRSIYLKARNKAKSLIRSARFHHNLALMEESEHANETAIAAAQ